MIKVGIIEEHPVCLIGVERIFEGQRECELVLASRLLPLDDLVKKGLETCNVLLVDLGMQDMEGDRLIIDIKEKFPQIKLIAYSGDRRLSRIARAFQAGASGYVYKGSDTSHLFGVIYAAYRNQAMLPPIEVLEEGSGDSEPAGMDVTPNLSDRERDVLKYLVLGYSTEEIARSLNIVSGMVSRHKESLMEKYGASNPAQLGFLAGLTFAV